MMNNEQNNSSNIERVVMRRIYYVRVLRIAFSDLALGALVLAVSLLAVGKVVWVARILENAPRDLANLPRFYLSAFSHTELTVQLLTVLTLISAFYLARAFACLIISVLTPARA